MLKNSNFLMSLVFFCAIANSVSAAIYYVDFAAGSDSGNGLSPSTAFKHSPGDYEATGTAAMTVLHGGDTVVFKGGVCYRSFIMCQWSGAAGNPITYDGNTQGTFGTGPAIIDGSEKITGFTQCQSAGDCGGNPNWQSIYIAADPDLTTTFASNMYEDDLMLWPSQDPDLSDPFFQDDLSTYRQIPSDNVTTTSVTDPSYFTQSDPAYWNGCYILLWGNPNIVRAIKITGYVPSGHKVVFDDTGTDSIYGSGRTVYYAMVNHLLNISVPGEYVIDEQTKTVYLWPRTGGDISQKEITFSKRNYGFNIYGSDYVTIQGFKIQKCVGDIGQSYCGCAVVDWFGGRHNIVRDNIMTANRSMEKQGVIRMSGGCSYITVENNYVYENPRNRGMILTFSNSVCRDNTMRKNGGTAIAFYGCVNSQMLGNTATEHRGVHANGLTLYLDCRNCLVAYNSVYDGHAALTLQDAEDITIAYNVLGTNVGSATAVDWGRCDGLYYYNNVMLNPGAQALCKDVTTTGVVAQNNILDGGDIGSGMSHNIYTTLSGGHQLNVGEIFEPDKSKIFVDPNNRDFHLKADSCAVNAGTEVGLDKDKDGAFVPCGQAPDIGAYEYTEGCVILSVEDFTRDGVVDFNDLKIMADDWLADDFVLDGMVSRYEFDGNANDSAGSNHGTAVGVPTYVAGIRNQAISVGPADYVDCGNDTSFNITTAITIAAWIKGTFGGTYHAVIGKSTDWMLAKGANNEALFVCLGAGNLLYGSRNINDNQWHHLAAVHDGSRMYLYVDGRFDASKATVGSLRVSASHVYIGGNPTSSFTGLVDDVRIYNRALSAEQVRTLYFGPEGDLNTDGTVNFRDFALFADNWLDTAAQF